MAQLKDSLITGDLRVTGTIYGNATSADKLSTARTINGTSFNGTANITTANWGTARNVYIADNDGTNTGPAVSVNGGSNPTLKLPATIKASLTGNASTATTLQTSRTINGTNFNGSANITTANWGTARNISIADSDGTNTGSAVSVNGSANATLKLPATIKATLTGHASLDLPLAGGTMTGQIKSSKAGGSWIQGRNNACLYQTITTSNNWHPVVGFKTPSGSWTIGNVGDNENCVFSYDTDTNFSAGTNTVMSDIYFNSSGYIYANRVYNAVWNDYAEYRNYNDGETPYGRVVCENGNDSVSLSTKRLQPGAMICSDTFGTSMGEAENTIPIAVAGRVLAYPLEPREEYNFFIGQAVCSGPNGTVSIMTKDEVKEYPECVVGYISAVPKYETWGTGNVKVDGRVWIKVK